MGISCYEYYYEIMSSSERAVYRDMYEAFVNRATSFCIPNCEYKKIGEIFERLTDDHPEIFYVKYIQIQSRSFISGYRIVPQYRFSKDEIQYLRDAVDDSIEKIVEKCAGKSPIEAEKIIHDYIVEISEYKDLEEPYSHEMPGVFLYGIGVCEGIAKAFKYLCDKLGIQSGIVIGNVKGEGTAHAWNQICIEGDWYNIDVTFNMNLSKSAGDLRYDYFNVSDMVLSDRCSIFRVHSCNHNYGFYAKANKFAKCQSDLRTIVRTRKSDVISVQLPHIACTDNELFEYIFSAVSDSIGGFGRHEISILPNYGTNVFTIRINKAAFF